MTLRKENWIKPDSPKRTNPCKNNELTNVSRNKNLRLKIQLQLRQKGEELLQKASNN